MRICIDSCIFIHGLQMGDPETNRLIEIVGPAIQVVIPRLVAQEVTRNLQSQEQVGRFYQLFRDTDSAFIVDELVPAPLVEKYADLGLPAKADAFIGAFAEWIEARYLISSNRHFLRDLRTDTFHVLTVAEFVSRWEAGTL